MSVTTCHSSGTELTTKRRLYAWWRHQMETFSALLALDEGNPQWRWAFICAWINGWANHRDTGDLRCHRAHYDVTVIYQCFNIIQVRYTWPLVEATVTQTVGQQSFCQVVRIIISSDSKFTAKQKFHAQACHMELIWFTTWRKILNICPLLIYFHE